MTVVTRSVMLVLLVLVMLMVLGSMMVRPPLRLGCRMSVADALAMVTVVWEGRIRGRSRRRSDAGQRPPAETLGSRRRASSI